MFSSRENIIFSYIFQEIKKNNINDKITNNNSIIGLLFNNINDIYNKFNDLKISNMRSRFCYDNFIMNNV